MTIGEKEGKKLRGYQAGLVVCVVVIIVLGIAFYRYWGAEHWWHITLQTEVDSLKAPKLIKVNLGASDNRPWFSSPYLYVYGEVCNVGTNTAYNCKIHVVLYQGSVIAKDTYIELGTIDGESWVHVDANVYYEGSAITSYSATLEWTSSP